MKILLRIFLLLVFFTPAFKMKAARPGEVMLDSSSYKKGIELSEHWLYRKGDNTNWSSPSLDDSGWGALENDTSKNDTSFDSIRGIFWERCTVNTSESVEDVSFVLRITIIFASEIYFDGKKIYSAGTVSDNPENYKTGFSVKPVMLPVSMKNKERHVVAVRSAKFGAENRIGVINLNNSDGEFAIITTKAALEEKGDFKTASILILFSGIFGVLAAFHMVLFLYYRKNRTNLYYSLFTLLLFIIFAGVYYVTKGVSLEMTRNIATVELFAIFFVPLFFIGILYEVFYKRLLLMFWIMTGMLVISLCLITFFSHENTGIVLVLVFLLVGLVETIRVFIRAFVKKKEGASIFLFGIFLPVIGIIFLSILSSALSSTGFSKTALFIDDNKGKFLGFSFLLSVSFSMTIYLARDFAKMNHKLHSQLREIKQLFDRTIQQENERKKILENQKEDLEKMVVIRTGEVMQQKAEIESKNRDIVDNLHYARRIQEAILPEIKLIYKTLSESFIIYLPKDIVSGDFYSFSQKDGKVIIAAADCTGHGVTGAFMSMIGTALLNQIVNEHGITGPAAILNHLNAGIVDALKNSATEINDGMDIALCRIDLETLKLTFAGANRPFWLMRDGDLMVIKSDKMAIGGFHLNPESVFTDHEVQLMKGDTFYIFTDGYADQFGGDAGRKFLSLRLKELLKNIRHMNMRGQEKFLLDNFKSWKSNNEQVDDVLVIGVRV